MTDSASMDDAADGREGASRLPRHLSALIGSLQGPPDLGPAPAPRAVTSHATEAVAYLFWLPRQGPPRGPGAPRPPGLTTAMDHGRANTASMLTFRPYRSPARWRGWAAKIHGCGTLMILLNRTPHSWNRGRTRDGAGGEKGRLGVAEGLRDLGAVDLAVYSAVADTPTPSLDETRRRRSNPAMTVTRSTPRLSQRVIGIAGRRPRLLSPCPGRCPDRNQVR